MKKPILTSTLKSVFTSIALLLGAACSTPQGYFGFEATDAQGKPINTGMVMTADGRGIYTVLSAYCSAYRGATIVIRNIQTKEELKPQSPHRCR